MAVDQQLLTQGVDPTDFWNVWRLTPEVFRAKDGNWVVKRDFGKLDAETLAEKAEFIFPTSLDIILSLHATKRAIRWQQSRTFYVNLRREGVPVFSHADASSQVSDTVPAGVTRLDTDYVVSGLRDDGLYWHVHNFEHGRMIWGFIQDSETSKDE